MKYYIIYQTKNHINNKIYIGQHITDNLNDGYLGSGVLLKKAIKKYGIENFSRTILFECKSTEELNAKEKEIVNEEFVNRKDTYNLKVGGDGGWDYINNNINTFERRSQIQKKRFSDPEQRRLTGEATKNGLRNMSEEDRKNMIRRNRISCLKSQKFQESIKKFNKAGIEWVKKEENRKLLSEKLKGKTPSNKGSILYYNPITNKKLYLKNEEIVPEGYVQLTEYMKDHTQNKVKQYRKKRHELMIKTRESRIKEVQEIADYYTLHGYEKTKQMFPNSKGMSSMESLLGTIRHYKQRYGIRFETNYNKKGFVNGSNHT